MKPLAVDLFCGLGGWADGFLAEGYDVVGFDNGHTAPYAMGARYPGQLVLQDVLTLHGSQFRNATVIVASPPCQEFSKYAMPFGALWEEHDRMDDDGAALYNPGNYLHKPCPNTYLFRWCFVLQREASTAAGRHIPMIVENVRGAGRFLGRSSWNFGSFHLYGDVPALMPINLKRGSKVPGFRFDGNGGSFQTASVLEGQKRNPDGTNHPPGSWFKQADSKNRGGSWFNVAHNTTSGTGRNPVHYEGERNDNGGDDGGDVEFGGSVCINGSGDEYQRAQEDGKVLAGMGNKGRAGGGWFGDGKHGETRKADPRDVRKQADGTWMTPDGTKIGGDWFSDPTSTCRKHGSRSNARKLASAQIAKIPFDLASHIARTYYPR